MKKLTLILPVLAALSFIVGIVEGSRPGGWGLGVPLGAVFVGLFLVLKVMGHEGVRYDEERQQIVKELDRQTAAAARSARK